MGEQGPTGEQDRPYSELDAFEQAMLDAILRPHTLPNSVTPDTQAELATAPAFDHDDERWQETLTTPPEELTDLQRAAVAQHLAICPDCRGDVATFAELPQLLDALPPFEFPEGHKPRWKQHAEERRQVRLEGIPPSDDQG